MNSLERVSLALQHKEADRIPVYPLLNSVSRDIIGIDYEKWTKNTELCAESIIKTTEELGLDVICSLVDLSVEAADWGQDLLYFEDDAACPDHNNRVIKSVEDYRKIKQINPRETPRMSEHIKLCDLLVKAKGNEVPVVAFVFGPLGIASMLRGQSEMFMDLILEPEAVKECVAEITKTLIEYCKALMETGVHAIMFDTLFASQSILSKQMWDDFEGEAMEELAKLVHDEGRMVMIHNCGDGIYFDAQINRMKPEAISFLHTPDDCISYEETKEKYGDKTTLIGCLDPGWLVSASLNEVVEETKKQIDVFKKDGGFILSTGCEYPSTLGFEKAKVIINTGLEYGKY
ncbi:uroporphyrinogen decarboxylase family protein [Clostridium grantii]|uniref:Uroporphyrinogen decarboxylase n=1 Tax=Clostridium grantii DSM 8605 TaxID=1121316 RepID=A0A1M5SZP5_9CLOT|nr:uroporphyrinogen decarboxylase family protein [Clostridium grantii]SHH43808.1 uroporphyrinogen decarboxylase [Clostridium grantii DSM 8605]